ncbi:bifunctional ADP-dependent NAD(P)H-hydrate dehydratase/NAD(P)H-hydrate epimerase [Candidatus Sodalis endolongispinus]|uniref:Bifunctional NAD(P)H-hydrate repair enzyme n=1 Tax=Candidatus Sodalis endolongispinus TaxID=2812662 RepID=A0ABS5Y8H3_9GAMM|nr:bifunctional ADP-dependent NAD(P)H-hydrate dehydratase/NAD(P)H-hydrate epimerase [Candidatus Sodalis endolongispinus]MBT9431307.1 bifunctional ADP-dependent NAD(P)H-hydrate dehydratase/NAD(P)H-hydrate epimerase [Candidatus Sodalis endolongispinus]
MSDRDNTFSAPSLSHSVYGAEWLRGWESQGAMLAGVPLYQLMERAGAAAFHRILWLYPGTRRWLVLAGHGNNGGDGYVVAQLAAAAGKQVTVLACAWPHPLPAEAEQAKAAWRASGGVVHPADQHWPEDVEVIIDALLGTGLKAAPRDPYRALIIAANRHPAPVFALDIPSGLDADTGATPGEVIRAAHTVTFIALKPGVLTGKARSVTGQLHYDDLGLGEWLKRETPLMARLSAALLPRWLPARDPCAHKGDNGRLLIVGGDHGFAGAIRMTGEAALRCGAGLVRVLTREENLPSLLTARPELMVAPLTRDTLQQGLDWADVVVIGPGLGQESWGKNALRVVENCDKPMLWDADALNLLAFNPEKRHNRIITPHPGEAARLLNGKVGDIERDRLGSARQLVRRYGGVVVLKGAGTLLAADDGAVAVADVGNAGMASGGMGDVLSGIIGGLLAQKLSLYDAACAGCVVHGATADHLAVAKGTRGMLATDLLPALYLFVNPELTA